MIETLHERLDREHTEATLDNYSADYETWLEDRVAQLEDELAKEVESRDGWRDAWKKSEAESGRLRLRHHQHTYCAYCGKEFPADIEGAVDAVETHIFACEKHPIAYIKRILKEEVWAEMTLGSIEEKRLFELLNLMDDKALRGE